MSSINNRERLCPGCKHIAKPFGAKKLLCCEQGCKCQCYRELASAQKEEK